MISTWRTCWTPSVSEWYPTISTCFLSHFTRLYRVVDTLEEHDKEVLKYPQKNTLLGSIGQPRPSETKHYPYLSSPFRANLCCFNLQTFAAALFCFITVRSCSISASIDFFNEGLQTLDGLWEELWGSFSIVSANLWELTFDKFGMLGLSGDRLIKLAHIRLRSMYLLPIRETWRLPFLCHLSARIQKVTPETDLVCTQ